MTNVPSSSLQQELATIDRRSAILVSREDVEWVRTKLGIIGRIAPSAKGLDITSLRDAIAVAYASLDDLPLTRFSSADIWNLILFIDLPDELDEVGARALLPLERDLSGSRKVLLRKGASVLEFLRPMAKSAGGIGADDPLKDAVVTIARDEEEYDALQLLFKRRLLQDDVDTLINALGRPNAHA